MRHTLAAPLAALGLFAVVSLGAQQAVPRPAVPAGPAAGGRGAAAPLPPPTGTGIIVGQVVDGSTNKPVGGAVVVMNGTGVVTVQSPGSSGPSPSPAAASAGMSASPGRGGMPPAAGGTRTTSQSVPVQRVMTDGDGRFVFHDLPKGTFNLSANSAGYTSGTYGQRKPNTGGQPLELDAGERVPDAVIRIWKYASITGTVVDEFGDPLVSVTVRMLRRTMSAGVRRFAPGSSTQTDDRGVFRIGSLTPGDYVVAIPTTTTSVPTSVVETFVRAQSFANSSGPGPDAQFAQQQFEQLINTFSVTGAPIPSTNGYRVGDVQLQSTGNLARATPLPNPAGKIFVYQTTYFAGAPLSSQAQVLTLASGEERSNVDFQMRLVQTARVSGTLSGPDGPAANIGMKLVPAEVRDYASESGYETASTVTDAQGQFTFLGVPVGSYMLRAQRIPRPSNPVQVFTTVVNGGAMSVSARPSAPVQQPPTEPTLWAETPVTVGDTDVTNMAVLFRPGARVSGRLDFEGSIPKPAAERLPQVNITVSSADGRSVGFQPAHPGTDGSFATMQFTPGKYFLSASSPGSGWILKSITANGRDVTQAPLVVESGDIGGVVVTFTDRQTQIGGTVQVPASKPDLRAMVVVFPSNYQAWIENGMSGRVRRSTTVAASGVYQFSNLPAGDYLAAVTTEDVAADLGDPSIYALLARNAAHVTLNDGDKKTLDLKMGGVRMP